MAKPARGSYAHQTHLLHRLIGDAVGFVVLVSVVGISIVVVIGMENCLQHLLGIAAGFLALAGVGYRIWIQGERDGDRWPVGIGISVLMALIFLPIDVILGVLFHPGPSLIRSTTSGLSFWLTMFICPLGTTVFLAGWARSAVLRFQMD